MVILGRPDWFKFWGRMKTFFKISIKKMKLSKKSEIERSLETTLSAPYCNT